jgi:hypothetical protein
MSDIKVRVGQQNSIQVISSVSNGSAFSENSKNVIGGIASVSQLNVSGISTFVGIATFINDVYIGGDLYVQDDLRFDEFTARNINVTGIATINNAKISLIYYQNSNTSGVAYFNSSGLMVSTGSTNSAINFTNYILTTDNSGVPTWSNIIDGGSY